ncbi:MAG: hypothetical protein ACP5KJ_00530 [Candidatus Micrarchaeia archaeon]
MGTGESELVKKEMEPVKKLGVEFLIMQKAPKYGIEYETPEYKRIRDKAFKMIEKNKSIDYIMKKVKEEMFSVLIDKDPVRAIKIETEFYKQKGKVIDEETIKECEKIAKYNGYAKASEYLKNAVGPAMKKPEFALSESAVEIGYELRKQFNINKMTININGEETTLEKAINSANSKSEKEKEEYVRKIIDAVMEEWRIKKKEEKEKDAKNSAENSFGLSYDAFSSQADVESIAEKRSINCFSGSVAAAALAASILKDTGTRGSVSITEVAAIDSMEISHAVAIVKIGKKSYLYDTTKIDKEGKGHAEVESPTIAKKQNLTYYLGSNMGFDDAVKACKAQQKLFDGQELKIEEFENLPPAYQKYVIEYDKKYIEFVKKSKSLNLNNLDPIVRMHIATKLFESTYNEEGVYTDLDEAVKYAKMIAESVKEISNKRMANSMKISKFYQQYARALELLVDKGYKEHAIIIYNVIRAGAICRGIWGETKQKTIQDLTAISKAFLKINREKKDWLKNERPEWVIDDIILAFKLGAFPYHIDPLTNDMILSAINKDDRKSITKIAEEKLKKIDIDPEKYREYSKTTYYEEQYEFLEKLSDYFADYFAGKKAKPPELYSKLKYSGN